MTLRMLAILGAGLISLSGTATVAPEHAERSVAAASVTPDWWVRYGQRALLAPTLAGEQSMSAALANVRAARSLHGTSLE